ncbi:glycosyltransferase [Ramlibacter terrae]|uniref:Glycosyltransferase n=1 Tax=Ramlibacter terrae TaxID=2732511 RepID=A0ABX6P3Q9_9BURK|nr:glycosyltransferase [Ramlibacter terrae]
MRASAKWTACTTSLCPDRTAAAPRPTSTSGECARLLAEEARAFRPAPVQAASNHEAALPALLAARAVGLPFVYEVRGLWEYTTASKIAGWEGTERFALERALETLVAREADLVFTLTAAPADELVLRGVDRARIRLAPNAIDPDSLRPVARDAALAASRASRKAPSSPGMWVP